jgi:hypothetical protein
MGDFKKGTRCKMCKDNNQKLSYEHIKNVFEKQGCELLSTEYVNSTTKLKYKCICGYITEIRWSDFQQGSRCIKCSNRERHVYNDVYNYFKEQNCELLETKYINFICECGEKSFITFNAFKNNAQRCPMCCYDNKEKSLYLYKDYELPSGKNIRIQGYEHIALDELVNNYKEDDILTSRKDMPEIYYNFQYILEDNKVIFKKHRYYPDIYIKSENKMIEVKSYYTYKLNLIQNIHKALATRKLGYDFQIWIINPYPFVCILKI